MPPKETRRPSARALSGFSSTSASASFVRSMLALDILLVPLSTRLTLLLSLFLISFPLDGFLFVRLSGLFFGVPKPANPNTSRKKGI
ncbi:hypothetical protein DFJ77DRAFT_457032 [Powellomyces hirtus]|nr:hypothetical protein DFJ77DRAFT_457032 [Powellomyces hirtus]